MIPHRGCSEGIRGFAEIREDGPETGRVGVLSHAQLVGNGRLNSTSGHTAWGSSLEYLSWGSDSGGQTLGDKGRGFQNFKHTIYISGWVMEAVECFTTCGDYSSYREVIETISQLSDTSHLDREQITQYLLKAKEITNDPLINQYLTS